MSATPNPANTPAKPVAKVGTTGHEWDGIQELNTPLPRWWLWLFYATIIWSIGYWVVYPAWPLSPLTAAVCSTGIRAARWRVRLRSFSRSAGR